MINKLDMILDLERKRLAGLLIADEYAKLVNLKTEVNTAIEFYEKTHVVHKQKILRCKTCNTPMIGDPPTCPYWDEISRRCEKG